MMSFQIDKCGPPTMSSTYLALSLFTNFALHNKGCPKRPVEYRTVSVNKLAHIKTVV